MGDSQARAPRYHIAGLDVIYDTGQEFWTGPVIDASETGLFIETAHELPIGTPMTIMLGGADDDRLPFEILGVVTRVNELDWDEHYDRTPGIAVRLEGMEPGEAEQFRAFLREVGTEI